MSHPDHIARSWAHAIELLYEDCWNPALKRYRSNLAFRGLSDAGYDLKTSLNRLVGAYNAERHLLRNFRKYAQMGDADGRFSDWRWLTVGQHHGLPTRLLDWTYSPFVALHFATVAARERDRDGVVWCVDYTQCNAMVPKRLRAHMLDAGSNVFTVEMLEREAPTLPRFDAMAKRPFTLFFEPPSIDARIVNQYALFSVMSSPTTVFDAWLGAHPGLYRRVVIPHSIKPEIRDKLDQANITERVLFPGLDGLAAWLTRHYQ